MVKWYEEEDNNQDIFVASRIRLLRNFKAYSFPCRQSKEEQQNVLQKLFVYSEELEKKQKLSFQKYQLAEMEKTHKKAFNERYLIPKAALEKKNAVGVVISPDESQSILLQCDDHIRMQISQRGLQLDKIWKKIDEIDDFFSQKEAYAFDEKLGYLTTFPTNVGTGMRAYVILHLPFLCGSEKLRAILQEIGRYGVTVRFGFGNQEENPGNLILLYNQKTLGVSEQEVIQILNKVSVHLKRQEERVRAYHIEHYRLEMEDRVYKSYGCLKYSRLLTLEDALECISDLQWGIQCGLIPIKESFNAYQMMIDIQPANLHMIKGCSILKYDLCRARAEYMREKLPEIESIE